MFDWNRWFDDESVGKIVAAILIATVIIGLTVMFKQGWTSGRNPLMNPMRLEVGQLTRDIMCIGFTLSAFFVGLNKLSDIPYTSRVFGAVFALTVFFCSADLAADSPNTNFWELMDPQLAIRFVLPPLVGFALGLITRTGLKLQK